MWRWNRQIPNLLNLLCGPNVKLRIDQLVWRILNSCCVGCMCVRHVCIGVCINVSICRWAHELWVCVCVCVCACACKYIIYTPSTHTSSPTQQVHQFWKGLLWAWPIPVAVQWCNLPVTWPHKASLCLSKAWMSPSPTLLFVCSTLP